LSTGKSPAQPNATRALDRPGTRKKVEAWILEGVKDAEIARRVGVHRSAIFRFRQRHEAEVTAAVAEVERQISDYAIANKVQRIADLDMLRSKAIAELDENGYAWDEPTKYGTKRKVSGAVADLKSTLHQAAEELGELPRPDVNINNNVLIIRDYGGIDTRALG